MLVLYGKEFYVCLGVVVVFWSILFPAVSLTPRKVPGKNTGWMCYVAKVRLLDLAEKNKTQ